MRFMTKTLLFAVAVCLAAALFAPKPSGAAEKMTLMLDCSSIPTTRPSSSRWRGATSRMRGWMSS